MIVSPHRREAREAHLSEVLLLRSEVVEASAQLTVPCQLGERLAVGGKLGRGGWSGSHFGICW